MTALTIRNLPNEVHHALRVRAAQHGRSVEAEVREILRSVHSPTEPVKVGSLLAEFGRQARLSDDEFAVFEQRRQRPDAR